MELPVVAPLPNEIKYEGMLINPLSGQVEFESVLTSALSYAHKPTAKTMARWAKYKTKHNIADNWMSQDQAKELIFKIVPRYPSYQRLVRSFLATSMHRVDRHIKLVLQQFEQDNLDIQKVQAVVRQFHQLEAGLKEIQGLRVGPDHETLHTELQRLCHHYKPRRQFYDQFFQTSNAMSHEKTRNRQKEFHLKTFYQPFLSRVRVHLLRYISKDPLSMIFAFLEPPEIDEVFLRDLWLAMEKMGVPFSANGPMTAAFGRHINPPGDTLFRPSLYAVWDVECGSVRIDDVVHPECWFEAQLPDHLELHVKDEPPLVKRRKIQGKFESTSMDMDEE